jgi:hypothetical protein
MEKHLALVNKETNRVENVLIVDSLDKDKIKAWETDLVKVIPIKDSIPFVFGLWNGETFEPPSIEYLIEIGVVQHKPEPEPIIEANDESSTEL